MDEQHENAPAERAADWSAAPAPTSTVDPQQPYRAEPNGWYGQGPGPVGPTAWYGAAAPGGQRSGTPRPPWFWPVLAIVIGVAALLVGGGAGFAIGHAIGEHQSRSSTTQVPGQGSNGFPGGTDGGTNQFPGQGS
ncbi:hypothetical protein AAEP80_17710 [Curtobacterium sp. L3-7]|jgi:hypothetical protein|uniref:hypothetical protein n=1 Tax=Curtobacterium sp. L3-7 TaxID=3138787 RepID=UPI003B51BF88